MSVNEIIVGDRVLVQSSEFTKEIAIIKAILSAEHVSVKMSDGYLTEINPIYILKSFGQ